MELKLAFLILSEVDVLAASIDPPAAMRALANDLVNIVALAARDDESALVVVDKLHEIMRAHVVEVRARVKEVESALKAKANPEVAQEMAEAALARIMKAAH